MRLDRLMFEKGLVTSRSRAQALIMAGKVFIDGKRADKAGQEADKEACIEVRGNDHPYVSRGGIKLEAALKEFSIDCNNKVALDVGASTGGFTDCLLQFGIKKVYALDVGYGQLNWKLRKDDRVINLEKTNIRLLDTDIILDKVNIVTIDCSFISLKLVLPKVLSVLSMPAQIICLIKPQFEVGKNQVEKGGVVRDREKHEWVLWEIVNLGDSLGLFVSGLMPSPIKGPKGNKEFIIYFSKGMEKGVIDIDRAIQKALL